MFSGRATYIIGFQILKGVFLSFFCKPARIINANGKG